MNAIVKSAVLVKLCPSIPPNKVLDDVVTFAAVLSCCAIRLIVKLPSPVPMVVTVVIDCEDSVGVASNTWSNALETVNPPARSKSWSVAKKADAWSSILNT